MNFPVSIHACVRARTRRRSHTGVLTQVHRCAHRRRCTYRRTQVHAPRVLTTTPPDRIARASPPSSGAADPVQEGGVSGPSFQVLDSARESGWTQVGFTQGDVTWVSESQ